MANDFNIHSVYELYTATYEWWRIHQTEFGVIKCNAPEMARLAKLTGSVFNVVLRITKVSIRHSPEFRVGDYITSEQPGLPLTVWRVVPKTSPTER